MTCTQTGIKTLISFKKKMKDLELIQHIDKISALNISQQNIHLEILCPTHTNSSYMGFITLLKR